MPVDKRREGFVVVGGLVAEQPGCGPVEPPDLGQHHQIPRTGQRRPATGNNPPMPRAPAYSSPLPSSRTDIDMSASWVAIPRSPNNRHSVG